MLCSAYLLCRFQLAVFLVQSSFYFKRYSCLLTNRFVVGSGRGCVDFKADLIFVLRRVIHLNFVGHFVPPHHFPRRVSGMGGRASNWRATGDVEREMG